MTRRLGCSISPKPHPLPCRHSATIFLAWKCASSPVGILHRLEAINPNGMRKGIVSRCCPNRAIALRQHHYWTHMAPNPFAASTWERGIVARVCLSNFPLKTSRRGTSPHRDNENLAE